MNTFALYHWNYNLLTLRGIWAALEHQTQLTELTHWAKRKRLTRPLKYYKWKLQEIEIRLCHYRLRHLQLLTLCEWSYTAYQMMIPKPDFYKKGSAAKYKRV